MKTNSEPTHDEIAARAQSIYEKEGRPQGKHLDHWLQAEKQLIAERKTTSAPATKQASQKPAQPAAAQAAKGRSNDGDWQASKRQSLHTN